MSNYLDSLPGSAGSTIHQIGRDLIQSIVALSVESVLWAVYLILAAISSSILIKKRNSWMSRLLLGTVWLMAILDTAMYIIDISNTVKEVSYTLTSSSDMSMEERYELTDNLPWAVQTALYSFLSNFGDIIVIWRVHAFYALSKDRWIVLFPIALLAGSFATSGVITYCSVYSLTTGAVMVAGNFVSPPLCTNAQMASYCTTLATTGVATLLIWYKTWQYRRTVGRMLWQTSSGQKSRVEKTMMVIVESGVLYFLFFLEAVIAANPSVGRAQSATTNLAFASTIWTFMTSHIISIYPVIVIILVHSQKQAEEAPRSAGTDHIFSHGLRDGDSLGISTVDAERLQRGSQRGPANVDRNVSLRNMRALEVAVHKTSIMYSDSVPLKEIASKKGVDRDDDSL